MSFERNCYLEGREESDNFSFSMSRGYMTIGRVYSNTLYNQSYFSFPMGNFEELLNLFLKVKEGMEE